ncbi:carboxylesterase family protein [Planctomicrobium piriforme]|uniref:Putative esterase n=1 Tax=Planctomicrobium piriforme TaxID=1576369 RepID=A0A1I3PDX9_9PLAN|nr:alpha/beta hydrolase-fold protein [Planctomicrobium piriforme]SFJ19745.1 Putative esterase [Planctomicrobium piriforme]
MTGLPLRHVAVALLAIVCWLSSVRNAVAETIDCAGLPPGFQLRTITDESGTHRYALFLPRNYTPDKKWPVVLFLHGAGEKGTDGLMPLSGTFAVALEKWPDAPFIAVFPQCEDVTGRSLTGWLAANPDGQRAMQVLRGVEQEFSVDPNHRVLVGWSMGGYGAWYLAAAHPKHWSAVLTLAGGAVPGTIDLKELAAARTPVWAISGKDDPLVSYRASQELIAQLNQLGGRGTYTLLDPAGHNICPEVFASRQTFDWLLQPDSIQPDSISFQHLTPLPIRTKFFRQCQVQARRIPDVLGIRLGNEALADLAPELPTIIPRESLEGRLPDIRKQLGSANDPWNVVLADVTYRCTVEKCWLHAISGGRLGVEFQFQPLELSIGQTTLESAKHSAKAGRVSVKIGLRKPAVLKLEVQPAMVDGRLDLKLLRKSFQFDDGNWYISPPEEIEVRSPVFTSDQMTTGLIGSLYGSRQQIIDEVLMVVPRLLETVEQQMTARPAPELARVLSPLPVLIPEIEVGPSHISTDAHGVSLICDVFALSRTSDAPLPVQHPLDLNSLTQCDDLQMQVALETITRLSTVSVEQNAAQVNVLDISDEKFAVLADPMRMQQVLPELDGTQTGRLRTVLRLLSPLVLATTTKSSEVADMEFRLSAEKVALDFYDERASGPARPIGRVVFSLAQPITLRQSQADQQINVTWQDRCDVVFLSGEALAGSAVPKVNGPEFETMFRAAWLSWGAEHGSQAMSTEVSQIGNMRIRLKRLESADGDLRFELDTVSGRDGGG